MEIRESLHWRVSDNPQGELGAIEDAGLPATRGAATKRMEVDRACCWACAAICNCLGIQIPNQRAERKNYGSSGYRLPGCVMDDHVLLTELFGPEAVHILSHIDGLTEQNVRDLVMEIYNLWQVARLRMPEPEYEPETAKKKPKKDDEDEGAGAGSGLGTAVSNLNIGVVF
jgi:hypothetical protein